MTRVKKREEELTLRREERRGVSGTSFGESSSISVADLSSSSSNCNEEGDVRRVRLAECVNRSCKMQEGGDTTKFVCKSDK